MLEDKEYCVERSRRIWPEGLAGSSQSITTGLFHFRPITFPPECPFYTELKHKNWWFSLSLWVFFLISEDRPCKNFGYINFLCFSHVNLLSVIWVLAMTLMVGEKRYQSNLSYPTNIFCYCLCTIALSPGKRKYICSLAPKLWLNKQQSPTSQDMSRLLFHYNDIH